VNSCKTLPPFLSQRWGGTCSTSRHVPFGTPVILFPPIHPQPGTLCRSVRERELPPDRAEGARGRDYNPHSPKSLSRQAICARFAASATRLKSCRKGAVSGTPPSLPRWPTYEAGGPAAHPPPPSPTAVGPWETGNRCWGTYAICEAAAAAAADWLCWSMEPKYEVG